MRTDCKNELTSADLMAQCMKLIEGFKNLHSTCRATSSRLEDIRYFNTDGDIWIAANWNDVDRYDKPSGSRIKLNGAMSTLWDCLSAIIGEDHLAWSDEYTECTNCYRAVRTSPDSHWFVEGGRMVSECDYLCDECCEEEYDADCITFDSFDVCAAFSLLAHDYGLYAIKTRLDRMEYNPCVSDQQFHSLSENAQRIYWKYRDRAGNTGSYDTRLAD